MVRHGHGLKSLPLADYCVRLRTAMFLIFRWKSVSILQSAKHSDVSESPDELTTEGVRLFIENRSHLCCLLLFICLSLFVCVCHSFKRFIRSMICCLLLSLFVWDKRVNSAEVNVWITAYNFRQFNRAIPLEKCALERTCTTFVWTSRLR